MAGRLFTLEEANALLPVVRRILVEIQTKKRELDALSAELDGLVDKTSSNGHSQAARMESVRSGTERVASDLDRLLTELHETGAELKGIEEGMVDFPSERDGRTVYLCWKMGEDAIRYWHELDTGFPGRQPLD